LAVLLSLLGPAASTAQGVTPPTHALAAIPDAAAALQQARSAPVMFIENAGQYAEGARFQVRGAAGGSLWLADDALWLTVLEKPSSPQPPSPKTGEGGEWLPSPAGTVGDRAGGEGEPRRGVNIKLSFVGANPHPRLEPLNRLDTHVSYFTGSDASQWRADVPVWGGVRYADLYPGVDLELTGEAGQYRQRLVARPGADLSAVRLRVEGADSLALLPSPDGGRSETGLGPALSEVEVVRVTTTVGEYTLPLLQLVAPDGSPLTVPDAALSGTGEIVQPFAPTTGLLDLPTTGQQDLLYSTYLGGSQYDYGYALAVDGSGNAYVTGNTNSLNFPTTPGVFDTDRNGNSYDVFVTKLNGDGSGLVYSTFLGGSGDDTGYAIAV
ncbi:MAG: hypothetical protein EPO30_11515, partial [Lysobacteraceae bacterium]